jgi:hypothetical protein
MKRRHWKPKPTRCNYCSAPPTRIFEYQGYISRDIRPITGGHMKLYLAACEEHVGCANWTGVLALHPEAREVTSPTMIERPNDPDETDSDLREPWHSVERDRDRDRSR